MNHSQILAHQKEQADAHAVIRCCIVDLGPPLLDVCERMAVQDKHAPREIIDGEVAVIADYMRHLDDTLLVQIGQLAVAAVVDEMLAMARERVEAEN